MLAPSIEVAGMDEQPFPLPRATRETETLVGDGGATYGPFGFKIFDTADVRALVRHDGGSWQIAAATVTKVAGHEFDDFTVTFDEALPATSHYRLQAARLHERQVAVTRGGAISGRALEKELSKQGSVIEELRRDVSRGGALIKGEAGQTLVFDEDGNVLPGADQSEIAAAQEYAEAAKGDADRAENAAEAAEAFRDQAETIVGFDGSAETVGFDGMASGLSATDVQEAIDEVVASSVGHQFETIAAAEAAHLVSAISITVVGDAPGAASEFGDAGTSDPVSPGQIEVDVAGVTHFYTRSNKILRPQQFGCKTGGAAAVNRAALEEMFALADLTGRTVDMGDANDIYEIDQRITATFANSRIDLRGTGATIKLVAASEQDQALRLLPSKGFFLEGFGVDGNNNTPNPFFIENSNNSNVFVGEAIGIHARNGRRQFEASYLGAGIAVRGPFQHVRLVSPDVRNMSMASDAWEVGINGICGIIVSRVSTSIRGAGGVEIIEPWIAGVAGDDPENILDQDGIRIFTDSPVDAGAAALENRAYIRGGRIAGARTRGIKLQTHAPLVDGVEVVSSDSNGQPLGVDFQWGSGVAKNCRFVSRANCGFEYGVLGTQRQMVQGAVTVEACSAIAVGANTKTMHSLAYLYSEEAHQPDSLSVRGNMIEQAGTLVGRIATIHSRTSNPVVLVTDNVCRGLTTAGLRGEGVGSPTIRAIFNNNINIGTTRPLSETSGATLSLVGSTSTNVGFT